MADDIIQRMHYCDRQFLRAKDFQDEQDYFLNSLRRLARFVLEPGVVRGLRVTGDINAKFVKVDAGTAIDKKGRQIVLITTQTLALPDEPQNGKHHISLAYGEDESDPSHDPGVTCNTRITETPRLFFSDPANPAPESVEAVLLAEVKVNNGLLAAQPNNDVRTQAGTVVGKKITVQKLTFEKPDVAEETQPILRCSGANELTLEGNLIIGAGNEPIPLVKTVKEMQAEIEKLDKKVKDLENKAASRRVK